MRVSDQNINVAIKLCVYANVTVSCVTRDIRESAIASIGAYGFFGASLRDDNATNPAFIACVSGRRFDAPK